MSKPRFEFLDHTADLKFVAYGKTLGECLENSAYAMFSAITDLKSVEAKVEKIVVVEAEDLGMLVHDFLSELIFLFATEHLLFRKFAVDARKVGSYQVHAIVSGEEYNPTKHELNMEVKAVTYHGMEVKNTNDGWSIRVVCDT